MARFIERALAKRLAVFFVNISPDQLNLKFFKGEGELRDLELNAKVLEQSLELPPFLGLEAVHCSRVTMKIPWRHLKHEPIVLYVDNLDIVVREPEEVVARHSYAEPDKATRAKPKQQKFIDDVLNNIQVEVKTVHIRWHTLPLVKGQTAASADTPHLVLDVKGAVTRSTNSQWKAVDLAQLNHRVRGQTEFCAFRTVAMEQFRLAIGGGGRTQPEALFADTPATIHLTTKTNALPDLYSESTQMDLLIDEVHMAMSRDTWAQLLQLVMALEASTERGAATSSVPAAPRRMTSATDMRSTDDGMTEYGSDDESMFDDLASTVDTRDQAEVAQEQASLAVSSATSTKSNYERLTVLVVNIVLEHWALEVTHGAQGLAAFGYGLNISSQSQILGKLLELSPECARFVDGTKTDTSISINFATFKDLHPNSDLRAQYSIIANPARAGDGQPQSEQLVLYTQSFDQPDPQVAGTSSSSVIVNPIELVVDPRVVEMAAAVFWNPIDEALQARYGPTGAAAVSETGEADTTVTMVNPVFVLPGQGESEIDLFVRADGINASVVPATAEMTADGTLALTERSKVIAKLNRVRITDASGDDVILEPTDLATNLDMATAEPATLLPYILGQVSMEPVRLRMGHEQHRLFCSMLRRLVPAAPEDEDAARMLARANKDVERAQAEAAAASKQLGEMEAMVVEAKLTLAQTSAERDELALKAREQEKALTRAAESKTLLMREVDALANNKTEDLLFVLRDVQHEAEASRTLVESLRAELAELQQAKEADAKQRAAEQESARAAIAKLRDEVAAGETALANAREVEARLSESNALVCKEMQQVTDELQQVRAELEERVQQEQARREKGRVRRALSNAKEKVRRKPVRSERPSLDWSGDEGDSGDDTYDEDYDEEGEDAAAEKTQTAEEPPVKPPTPTRTRSASQMEAKGSNRLSRAFGSIRKKPPK